MIRAHTYPPAPNTGKKGAGLPTLIATPLLCRQLSSNTVKTQDMIMTHLTDSKSFPSFLSVI